jgi:hypothetical protein
MVDTRASNKKKRPGLPDLPTTRREANVDNSGSSGNNDSPRTLKPAQKPTAVKARKANKARAQATNAVAQLEMAMELEDALKQNSARRSDAPRLVKKVPRQKLGADGSGQEHPGMPRYDSITRQILMDLLMIN